MKTIPALLLGCLLWIAVAEASQPTLQSVSQPLYYHLTASDSKIEIMPVPKIFTGADRDQWLPLIQSPTQVVPDGPDLNLISRYGLRLAGESQPPHGIVPKITIDATAATQPENYPFTIEEVVNATVKCIRTIFDDATETEIWLTDKDGSRKIEKVLQEHRSMEATSKSGIKGVTVAVAEHSKGGWMNSRLFLQEPGKAEKRLSVSYAFIEKWGFADEDKSVVVRSRNARGPSWIQKFDIASGEVVAECQGSNALNDTPEWARPWADFTDRAEGK